MARLVFVSKMIFIAAPLAFRGFCQFVRVAAMDHVAVGDTIEVRLRVHIGGPKAEHAPLNVRVKLVPTLG